MTLLAMMLENHKRYTYSKNKITNLAKKIYDLQVATGCNLSLSNEGRTHLPTENSTMILDEKPKSQIIDFELCSDVLIYKIYGKENTEQYALPIQTGKKGEKIDWDLTENKKAYQLKLVGFFKKQIPP